MNIEDEIRHLKIPPEPTEKPGGLGIVRFTAKCPGNAELVLRRVLEILEAVLKQLSDDSQADNAFELSLPEWFVSACAPEKSMEEAEKWLKWLQSLKLPDQRKASKVKWSLENWLYWFEPDMRQWFWWDAIIQDKDIIIIAVEVESYPFAWGALEWLFRASGASDLQPED